MKKTLADRVGQIEPFRVMAMLTEAKRLESLGRNIIHMEVGEPDFVTPDPIIEAGKQALSRGLTHYTPSTGIPELKQRIADYYADNFQVDISAERIVITPGASGALLLVAACLVQPNRSVIMSDPGYPCNRHFVTAMGGEALTLPVGVSSDYQLSGPQLADHWREDTVAAMVASPSNPTGTLLTYEQLAALFGVTEARGGYLIVDEIYQGLTYQSDSFTALSLSSDLFVINSFSKFFGMTGWRLGWLVAPEPFIEPLERLAQNLFIAPPTIAQYAALAAFEPSTRIELERRRKLFEQRRDYLLPELRALGFDIAIKPEGAFYLYANVSELTDDSEQFALDLLEHAGVAVTPGSDFGTLDAHKYLRFSYTTGMDQLKEGVRRIRQFLNP